MHFVALHEALVLLVDRVWCSGKSPNVLIQIPAQIFIKHCSQEVKLLIIVFLSDQKRDSR